MTDRRVTVPIPGSSPGIADVAAFMQASLPGQGVDAEAHARAQYRRTIILGEGGGGCRDGFCAHRLRPVDRWSALAMLRW